MKVLVTGGCGYIGSHTIVDLLENGFEVVCLDSNISSGEENLRNTEKITGIQLSNHRIDLCNLEDTRQFFKENDDIQSIIHFAALKSVSESILKPLLYHDNNINSLINLLKCAKEFNVNNFLFSSSCSVYGNVEKLPVTENTPIGKVESPYARTKQICEYIIKDFSKANPNVNSILLRYFNPAGAHPSLEIGELPFGEAVTLVPIITDTAFGRREKMIVLGADYDTRDGSCIRDYIHIMDLANAHTKGIQYLLKGINSSNCEIFNVGTGKGVTVLEMINAFEKATSTTLNYEIGPRRAGDIIAIYADYTKAKERLGWTPKYNIEDIMKTSWGWELKKIKG